MVAVHTVTLWCDGKAQRGCPGMRSIVLEAADNGEARYEAARQGWTWRWGRQELAAANTRKKIDICPECDPIHASTR